MTDKQVSKAMELQPQRIASMMFVRTRITNEQDKLKINPDNGDIETEDENCD